MCCKWFYENERLMGLHLVPAPSSLVYEWNFTEKIRVSTMTSGKVSLTSSILTWFILCWWNLLSLNPHLQQWWAYYVMRGCCRGRVRWDCAGQTVRSRWCEGAVEGGWDETVLGRMRRELEIEGWAEWEGSWRLRWDRDEPTMLCEGAVEGGWDETMYAGQTIIL